MCFEAQHRATALSSAHSSDCCLYLLDFSGCRSPALFIITSDWHHNLLMFIPSFKRLTVAVDVDLQSKSFSFVCLCEDKKFCLSLGSQDKKHNFLLKNHFFLFSRVDESRSTTFNCLGFLTFPFIRQFFPANRDNYRRIFHPPRESEKPDISFLTLRVSVWR